MTPNETLARRFWHAIEPLHAVVYFAHEPLDAARRVGLRGFWMGYFAGRVAPMGAVAPASLGAMAYGFAPEMVARALPDAWRYASPDDVLEARIEGATMALRHHVAESGVDFGELSVLLWDAVTGCHFDARPLAAAWASVARPSDPTAATWLAATILREHRGDGHVLAAVGGGLRGLDATLTFVATGSISREVIQPSRGWSDAEWDESRRRLQARGLLDRGGRLTKTGGALRRDVEDLTDRLAAGPVERLGATGVERAIAMATPASRHLFDIGVIPLSNPIGVPRT